LKIRQEKDKIEKEEKVFQVVFDDGKTSEYSFNTLEGDLNKNDENSQGN
jgi:hypothetical protein